MRRLFYHGSGVLVSPEKTSGKHHETRFELEVGADAEYLAERSASFTDERSGVTSQRARRVERGAALLNVAAAPAEPP